jgi:ATPase subunit of ABC transporter with duplicated ATPase domains
VMVLENLLSTFTGGFLLVSHDRAFASNVADSLYYLEHGRLTIA